MAVHKGWLIYLSFVAIVAVSLVVMMNFDKEYRDEIVGDLNTEYNVNVQAGEELVECPGGNYEIYKPQLLDKQGYIELCGEIYRKPEPEHNPIDNIEMGGLVNEI